MTRKAFSFFLTAILLVSVFAPASRFLFASTTNGTIDSTYKYAEGLDDTVGTINFGLSAGDVHVTDTALTGYAWGETVGWINLAPTYGGVTNNAEGTLSGYAWGELAGWINFAPSNGGVTIDSSGVFSGYAWSENFGWIIFNCATNSSCSTSDFKVATDWRPASTRSSSSTPTPSNGTPGVGGSAPTPPSSEPSSPPSGQEPEISPTPETPPGVEPESPPGIRPEFPVGETLTPGGPEESGSIGESITEAIQFVGGQIKESYTAVLSAIESTREELRQVIESPVGSLVTKAVTVSGILATGAASLSVLFLNPLSVSEIVLIPFRLWSLLLAAFGLKKRNRPWGTVYDSVTKQPLDPAYVTLTTLSGEEIKGSITDLDGRYGFLLSPGVYRVRAGKTNYRFPSSKLAGKSRDELYGDLYFGEKITALGEDDVITRNIPMDQEGFDWNEFAKRKKSLTKFYKRRDLWVTRISNILFTFGFAVALAALFSAPAPYNIIIFLVYLGLLALRIVGLKPRAYGILEEKATGLPLSFAIVRVEAPGVGQILQAVSDEHGRYYCLVPPGEYTVGVEKKNDDESYSLVYKSDVMSVPKGIINQSIAV